jgi:hypothetical protein
VAHHIRKEEFLHHLTSLGLVLHWPNVSVEKTIYDLILDTVAAFESEPLYAVFIYPKPILNRPNLPLIPLVPKDQGRTDKKGELTLQVKLVEEAITLQQMVKSTPDYNCKPALCFIDGRFILRLSACLLLHFFLESNSKLPL